jgi:hypothetical protein
VYGVIDSPALESTFFGVYRGDLYYFTAGQLNRIPAAHANIMQTTFLLLLQEVEDGPMEVL